MPLPISAANLIAAKSDNPYIIDFVKLMISNNTAILLSTHIDDITLTNGETYQASGEFLGFGSIQDNLEAKDNTLPLRISGVQSTYTSVFLQNNIEGSPVFIYRGYLDVSTGLLVDDPTLRYAGVIDNFAIDDRYQFNSDDAIEIIINVKNLMSTILRKVNGRYTSPSSFDNESGTGDKSMEFVADTTDFTPSFGKEN